MSLLPRDANEWTLAAILAGAFVASLGATWAMVRHGRRLFLDTPNARSAHQVPTPRGGGIAFVGVFCLAVLLEGMLVRTDLRADVRLIPLVVFPLILVGVVDDLRGLAPPLRFLAQMLTACLIVILLGKPLPTFVGQVGVPATALLLLAATIPIAAAINFYNFMDGLDGLVAGTSAVQLAFLAWWLDVPPAWTLVAALGGFLVWNWPRAKIFMGDTGSTFLGASPIMFGILSNRAPTEVVAAWAVTAPLLFDATATLLRRGLRGANLIEGHREHLYQRLQRAGWSHARVTLCYMTATAACAAAIAAWGIVGAAVSVGMSGVLYIVGDRYARGAGVPQ
jgi:UDP-N-acetylmuramyl pentapeptide phosphotransferase/UDP-N-acetylglucosamine-1-phosphate transferase